MAITEYPNIVVYPVKGSAECFPTAESKKMSASFSNIVACSLKEENGIATISKIEETLQQLTLDNSICKITSEICPLVEKYLK